MWNKGDILSPIEKGPLTKQKLYEYAKASGDLNPIHLDDETAKEVGLPSVIVHGMISMAFIADYIATYFPSETYKLNLLKAKFKKVIFPGQKLKCNGVITDIGDDGTIVLSVQVKNESNEVVTEGKAHVSKVGLL